MPSQVTPPNGQGSIPGDVDELTVAHDAATPAHTTVYLSQSSHLDWDWLLPFPVLADDRPATKLPYFTPPSKDCTRAIFEAAIGRLCPGGVPDPAYFYSVCEIGFLREFVAGDAGRLALLKAAGQNLRIVGGGITSPDNLLPHGEALIRNYLIGKRWVDGQLGLPMRQAWLPDDFGHDPQLPVLLEATGFQGVAFWRIPGSGPMTQTPVDDTPSVAAQLTADGADFVWAAADGSSLIAHWLQGSYCQGDTISDSKKGSPAAQIAGFVTTNPRVTEGRDSGGSSGHGLDLV